jgi:antitoxin CptB
MRRGTKEMDIIMMCFAEARLAALSASDLDLYDRILEENDQDLYAWVTGQTPAPQDYAPMMAEISRLAYVEK